jgi:hypothetical protein
LAFFGFASFEDVLLLGLSQAWRAESNPFHSPTAQYISNAQRGLDAIRSDHDNQATTSRIKAQTPKVSQASYLRSRHSKYELTDMHMELTLESAATR